MCYPNGVFLSWSTRQVISFLLHLMHLLARGLGSALGNPLSSSPLSPHTHAHAHTLPSLSFAPSLLSHPHSSCEEHSAMFLLAELCRLSLRAWKTSQRAHFSHFLPALCEHFTSASSSHHPGSQAMQDRVGQIRPLAYITSTSSLSLFLCLQSLSIIHSLSIQIPLSGGYLPFFDLSEQASWVQVCECLRYCSLMRESC